MRFIATDYPVIRITQFQTHTGRDLNKTLNQLKEREKPIKGLILDLRNNPGGVLGGAISVADAFLDKGLIQLNMSFIKTIPFSFLIKVFTNILNNIF